MVRRYYARAELSRCSNVDHWIVTRTAWRQVLEAERVAAGADLLKLFLQRMLRYLDEGWQLNDFNSYSAEFFIARDGEKRSVEFTSVDPAAPHPYRGNLMARD
jgi:hypothetical protein